MKLALLGDIALFGNNCIKNNNGLKNTLNALKSELRDFDYIIANLEAPLTNSSSIHGSKSVYINSDPLNVEILKFLGINAVALSNNHIYDFGYNGVLETIRTLESAGIEWFGLDGKFLKLNILGQKLAVHGYCSYNTNPSYNRISDLVSKNGLNLLHFENVTKQMTALHNDGYFNVLSVHSGIENVSVPSIEDILFAKNLASKFDYIYHGHHPHVIQGLEKYNGSILSFSQGNCIFDDIYDHRTGNKLVEQSFVNSCSYILTTKIVNNRVESFSTVPFSFYNGSFILNCNESKKMLKERSNLLGLREVENNNLRRSQIKKINLQRSSKRDLRWFFSRLRFSTLKRMFNNQINSYLYNKNYKKRIGDE